MLYAKTAWTLPDAAAVARREAVLLDLLGLSPSPPHADGRTARRRWARCVVYTDCRCTNDDFEDVAELSSCRAVDSSGSHAVIN